MLPLFGIAGNMGAGKSTVAKLMMKNFKFIEVVQAGPMKVLAGDIFGFDADALYGPTEERNKLRTGGIWEAKGFFEQLDLVQELVDASIITAADAASPRVIAICKEAVQLIKKFYDENGGLTARYVLQIIGTEVGRTVRITLWTERAVNYSLEQLAVNCPDIVPLDGAVISDVRFRSELLTIKRNGGTVIKVVDPDAPPPPANEHISESELRGIPDYWFDAIWENRKSGESVLEQEVIKIMTSMYGVPVKESK